MTSQCQCVNEDNEDNLAAFDHDGAQKSKNHRQPDNHDNDRDANRVLPRWEIIVQDVAVIDKGLQKVREAN